MPDYRTAAAKSEGVLHFTDRRSARLATTYWVLPSIMVGLAVILAALTSAADRRYQQLPEELARLADRRIPAGYYYHEGSPHLITDTFTFCGIMRAAFDQIRQASRGDITVTGHPRGSSAGQRKHR